MYACNCCMFALLFVCRCIAQIQLRGGQGVALALAVRLAVLPSIIPPAVSASVVGFI